MREGLYISAASSILLQMETLQLVCRFPPPRFPSSSHKVNVKGGSGWWQSLSLGSSVEISCSHLLSPCPCQFAASSQMKQMMARQRLPSHSLGYISPCFGCSRFGLPGVVYSDPKELKHDQHFRQGQVSGEAVPGQPK